jgi:hypothetical protein
MKGLCNIRSAALALFSGGSRIHEKQEIIKINTRKSFGKDQACI